MYVTNQTPEVESKTTDAFRLITTGEFEQAQKGLHSIRQIIEGTNDDLEKAGAIVGRANRRAIWAMRLHGHANQQRAIAAIQSRR